jgi:hypothetical protein
VVHIVRRGAPEADVEAYLASRGIAFCYVDPFGDGRFANKIAQLTSPALRRREYAVLCDLDLAATVNERLATTQMDALGSAVGR